MLQNTLLVVFAVIFAGVLAPAWGGEDTDVEKNDVAKGVAFTTLENIRKIYNGHAVRRAKLAISRR